MARKKSRQPKLTGGARALPPKLADTDGQMQRLWRRRERIHDIPALILWGMHDPAFRQEELDRLQTVFSHKRTACFHGAGHFPQEERSERAISLVEEFLTA